MRDKVETLIAGRLSPMMESKQNISIAWPCSPLLCSCWRWYLHFIPHDLLLLNNPNTVIHLPAKCNHHGKGSRQILISSLHFQIKSLDYFTSLSLCASVNLCQMSASLVWTTFSEIYSENRVNTKITVQDSRAKCSSTVFSKFTVQYVQYSDV